MAAVAARGPVLVADIGGTKIAAGVVGPDGELISSTRVATPGDTDAEELWLTLERVMVEALGRAGIPDDGAGLAGLGCGSSGPMEWPSGRVSPLNIPAWRDFPLRDRLAERFGGGGGLPVRVHNDAICVAAAEHWRGAGQGCRDMLGMVISTGVGGGLILDGRLVAGGSGNAGHIGHVVVEPADGPPCGCGGRGCLEAVARGPAIARRARRAGWRPDDPAATAKELAADAADGHPIALGALRQAGQAIGVAIASATSLCDLEVVSIGGGLSQAGEPLFGPLREKLAEHAGLDFTRDVRVVPAALGQVAGLIGAAALLLAADRYWTAPG